MNVKYVGIDGNEANVTHRVGSNVYAFELIWALYRQLEQHPSPSFSVRVYLRGQALEDLPPSTSFWEYRVITPAKLWTQWRLPLDLYFGPKVDLFFSPGHYTPRFCPVPVVPSIMDVAFEFFPEQFKPRDAWQLTSLTRDSVKKAAHVVAISEHAKGDVAHVYHYPASKITVIYPAVKIMKKMSLEKVLKILKEMQLHKPYIAFVGTLQPRKNIVRLIEAFEALAQSNPDLELVLAGKIGWLSDSIEEKITNSPYRKRIHQTGFVSDEQKQAIIQGAVATTLVGLHEGFGIPPLESILLGTPAVVSAVSSLPEVVGPEGVFVDPYDVASITAGLQEVLEWSASVRETRVLAMQKYAEKFDWDVSGQKLLTLLEKMLVTR